MDYNTLTVPITENERILRESEHIAVCCTYYSTIKIFVVIGQAKRAPHWGVQSRFRVIYIYNYVGMYVCRM